MAKDAATFASAPAKVTSSEPGSACLNLKNPGAANRAMTSPKVTVFMDHLVRKASGS
jgi:hypothetical protein